MKKSVGITIGFLASVAVSACSDNRSEAQRECVDNRTSVVVDRDWCSPSNPHYAPIYAWYYGGTSYRSGSSAYMRGGSYTSSRSFGRSSPTVSRGVIGGSHAAPHAGG
jgi:hypothetical protein